MNPKNLNKKYFSSNSRGYKILNRYYNKYADLFRLTIYPDYNDFLNQVFINISQIDFSKDIENEEAYIIGAIKIQCRVQIDKAIRSKKIIAEGKLKDPSSSESENSLTESITSTNSDSLEILEGEEIFNKINKFKLSLKFNEIEILNFLIDEKPRTEIADAVNLNLNTLDTQIRRLRIKFISFLKKEGYNFKAYSKFEK